MRRRCGLLVLGGLLLAVAPVLWLSARGWDAERGEMSRRFDRVQVGGTLSEAKAAIGMECTGVSIPDGQRAEVVAGRDTDYDRGEYSAGCQCDRYAIVIHFDPRTDRVTGKGLLRVDGRAGWAERLLGP
jgi:hypothetical protein